MRNEKDHLLPVFSFVPLLPGFSPLPKLFLLSRFSLPLSLSSLPGPLFLSFFLSLVFLLSPPTKAQESTGAGIEKHVENRAEEKEAAHETEDEKKEKGGTQGKEETKEEREKQSPESTYTSLRHITLDYFSTVNVLQVYGDFTDPQERARFEETWQEVLCILKETDDAISLSWEESDMSIFSRSKAGEMVSISSITKELLDKAKVVYEASEGLYDPTVSILVDLFGFTPLFSISKKPILGYDRQWAGSALPLPEEETVQKLLELVDFGTLTWGDGYLLKRKEDVFLSSSFYGQSLDLGGLAKGYAVDRVMEVLKQKGYAYGYFSCGGSSIGILSRPTASEGAPLPGQWGLSIQKPRFALEKEDALRLYTQNARLSTSGDYEHCYFLHHVRYCHLIDPTTGWPINPPEGGEQKGICSMTVLGEDASLCDALSTALCVMGPLDAIAFMNREENLSPSSYVILDPEHYKEASLRRENGRVSYAGTIFH